MMKTWFVLLVSVLLFACSQSDSGESDETIGKEIADDYNAAMDKAANVEAQLKEQQEKMDEALREAEKATQDP